MEEIKTYYTEEGYKKLVDELEYLKGPKMKEVKEALAAARDLGEEIEYSIVGTNEADALAGKISDQSPIGSALLGARKGETVTVETPNGALKFKVLDVWRVKNN